MSRRPFARHAPRQTPRVALSALSAAVLAAGACQSPTAPDRTTRPAVALGGCGNPGQYVRKDMAPAACMDSIWAAGYDTTAARWGEPNGVAP